MPKLIALKPFRHDGRDVKTTGQVLVNKWEEVDTDKLYPPFAAYLTFYKYIGSAGDMSDEDRDKYELEHGGSAQSSQHGESGGSSAP